MADEAFSPSTVPVIEAHDISVTFRVRGAAFRGATRFPAVRNVSLQVMPGEVLGVVGESGSGKSTLARALLRLVGLESGQVLLDGFDITGLPPRQLRSLRQKMQMVFQDPYSSLDPSATIADIIGEPLAVHRRMSHSERGEWVHQLLDQVGLDGRYALRYPYEFSGGQRQRIAIARAIALHPKLLVLDEAVSALDVSTQNQVLELLDQLRGELDLAYVFISHNLGVVRWLADRTAVMYLGEVVETGPTERIYTDPKHPYTESLLSAIPVPDPNARTRRERVILTGDAPNPADPPSGCPFRTRCHYAMAICAEVTPEPVDLGVNGWVSCLRQV